MATKEIPETPELIGLVRGALDDAHRCRKDWGDTRAIKSHVWKLGFDYTYVYPVRSFYRRGDRGHAEFEQAEALAQQRLAERGAQFWPRGEEHSVLKEFHYDVTWVEFDGEYTGFDMHNDAEVPQHFPRFKRTLLALESELSGGIAARRPRWQVLYDFHKLLCARAELRVMVWPKDKIEEGVELLESRLVQADGWDDGYWLLCGWGRAGIDYVEYHNGEEHDR